MSSGTDYTLEDSVYLLFTTRAFATGIPGTLSAATIAVYEDVTATPVETGIAVTESLNSIAGLNAVTIAALSASGYNNGGAYHAVIEAGTVDSVSVVGEVIGHFTIGHSAAAVDLANATDGLGVLKTLIDTVNTDLSNATDGLGAIKSTADAIETDTQNIQSRIPASLFNSRMDSTIDGTGMESGAVTNILTTQMIESYAANGVAPTLAQAQFAIHQMLMQFGISGTSLTVRKLNNSTTAFIVTLDSSSVPTDAKRV